MMKKLTLLAMAVGALVAFAAPASASAEGVFTHNHEPIETNAEVTLSGRALFSAAGSSYECEVNAEATFEPGGTGSVTSFLVNPTGCVGTGALVACELSSAPAATPFGITATHEDIDISGVELTNNFVPVPGVCNVKKITLTVPSVTATPDNPTTISDVTLSGTGEVHILNILNQEATAGATVSGTLSVTPAGTYGVE